MQIHHFSHQHPLVFIQHHSFAGEAAHCFACDQPVEGPRYGCDDCNYHLHKPCAELEFPSQVEHPFHPQHPLILLPKYHDLGSCNFCERIFKGFAYRCASCDFDMHGTCALLQVSVASNFPTCLHQHPLFLVENHDQEVINDCCGCKNPLSGPIYHCSDCTHPMFFNLHKKCAESTLEINHPYDRKHPLTLLPAPATHPLNCSCYMCKIQCDGFVYSCSLCNFELTLDDFLAPKEITVASHGHPWILLLKRISFVCDFCGISGDHSPYLCITCNLVVHRKCISMPRNIVITRHPHMISHSLCLHEDDQFEDWMCRICYEEVDTRFGGYYCSEPDCNYIAHVLCATNKAIWDGTVVSEDDVERCMEAPRESLNLITDVVEQMSIGDHMVTVEIRHAYHDHNLRLVFSREIEDDDSQCDGCMRLISTPFYSCEQCKFFLHKDCAELPREIRHPFHNHLLTLSNSNTTGNYLICYACWRPYHGFSYQCDKEECGSFFRCDIRCVSLSDTLKHPSHEHSLFLVHDFPTKCSGCLEVIFEDGIAYRCMKRCDFTLDIRCATLPYTARYKYDKHPLTLTYSDDSSPSQHYCDLCENERDPNDWFHYCVDCDNSLHSICAVGDPLFMKLGSKVKFSCHQHPLTVVKNIWNCRRCKVCSNLCSGPALECKESKCNYIIHCECGRLLYRSFQ